MELLGGFQPVLLAGVGHPLADTRRKRDGLLGVVDGQANQYLFLPHIETWDNVFGTHRDKTVYTRDFRDFLEVYRPDVVHFQHTRFLGYDMLRQVRATLPKTPILYTLHEYWPICQNNGLMIRTTDGSLCDAASPARCNLCFPEISAHTFFLRQRYIQAQLGLVDMFLAPSQFLLRRYLEWGIPRTKIQYEQNGRAISRALPPPQEDRPRNRIAFFGQFAPHKGVDVLLAAMQILNERHSTAHLWIHGPLQQLRGQSFEVREKLTALMEATRANTTIVGEYTQQDLPGLMSKVDWVVIPSTWWENSPLVIQEAFAFGRPIICSDIGGMAEKVQDGVNGLHFRKGDPVSLADVIDRAINTPGQWQQLQKGITPVYGVEQSIERLGDLYNDLIAHRGESRTAGA
jgi:glycosyltransferase involved in cell wall biosynthesis